MRQLPTVAEAAILLVLNAKRKEREAGKEMDKLRMSEKTFRKTTGRRRLHPGFLADLNESLADFNWHLVLTADAIGMHKAAAVKEWPRINARRIDKEIEEAREGEFDFGALSDELVPSSTTFDEEEEEDWPPPGPT